MGENPFARKDVQSFMENLWDAVYIVDRDKNIFYWSKSAEELTGYSSASVLGRKCGNDLLSHHCESAILCSVACPLQATLADGQIREAQVSLTRKDGVSIPVRVRTLPFLDDKGSIAGAVEVFRRLGGTDEIAHLLQELNNLANVDPLTKAARRNYGEAVVERALASFAALAIPFGVLLIDLDDFKTVNDTFGHAAGDCALACISDLIRQNLRTSDLLVRWGGDEFLIVASGTSLGSLAGIGEKLCRLAAETRLTHAETTFFVTISIGGTLPRQGDTVLSLVERADRQMYASKRLGKNRCTV